MWKNKAYLFVDFVLTKLLGFIKRVKYTLLYHHTQCYVSSILRKHMVRKDNNQKMKILLLYEYKHFNWISATLLALCTLTIEPITRIIFAIVKGSLIDIVETLKAYKLLWSAILKTSIKWGVII